MDTLTHALSGVLAARALYPRVDRRHLFAAAVAAAFPDIDYALILVDPRDFLNLHRGPTHSLLLLPLWAGLLALPLGRVLGLRWRTCAVLCALGLGMHVLGDWVTLYGTQLLFPLSHHAYALRLSFDLNPWIAAVTLAGALVGSRWRPRASAFATLATVAVLLAGQGLLGTRALAVAVDQARRDGLDPATALALPQPLSPTHWALVIVDGDGYRMAYLDLQDTAVAVPGPAWWRRMHAAYHSEHTLSWTRHASPWSDPLAVEAWRSPALAAFRHFAALPVLWRVERTSDRDCAWFTDLRHWLPVLPASFRYGACRDRHGAWRPYRLRYLSDTAQQAL